MAQRFEGSHPAIRRILLFFIVLMIRLLARVSVAGVDNLPRSGPVVLVFNHIGFFDPVVCGVLPRELTPIAKKEAFDIPVFGPMMALYGTISISRGDADLGAMKAALKVLKQGGVVMLAPEGTRSPNFQLQAAKEGAVMLALRSGAPVVPVGVTGTHRLKSYWRKIRRAPVNLSVGEPFYIHSLSPGGRASRADMIAMTHEMMYRLARQLPPEFRGIYSNLDEATETYIVSAKDVLQPVH